MGLAGLWKKEAKDSRGIYTNIDEICNSLKSNLIDAEDVTPNAHADEWVERYLDHVDRHEYNYCL